MSRHSAPDREACAQTVPTGAPRLIINTQVHGPADVGAEQGRNQRFSVRGDAHVGEMLRLIELLMERCNRAHAIP
jgi:hypothetical protein